MDSAKSYSSYLSRAYIWLWYSNYYEWKYSESIQNYTTALKILEKYKSIYSHIYDIYIKENLIEKANMYKDIISEFETKINQIKSDIKESKRLLD